MVELCNIFEPGDEKNDAFICFLAFEHMKYMQAHKLPSLLSRVRSESSRVTSEGGRNDQSKHSP